MATADKLSARDSTAPAASGAVPRPRRPWPGNDEPLSGAASSVGPASVLTHRHKTLRRIRAWMVVPPVDAMMLLIPACLSPGHLKASVCLAAIFLLLLCGAGRYRARLHMSVLDELPVLLSKLLTACAVVATVIALRHDAGAVEDFLLDSAVGIGLVVAARVAVTQVILWSRRHRVTSHCTVLVGGGPVAAEMAQTLARHPRYGLEVVGYVDEDQGPAGRVTPWLGGPWDLDLAVRSQGVDVLLVVDGSFTEHLLRDLVRTPACLPCDLLVVPRLHDFHTQTGVADHIGSIPVMRIRTPNLQGLKWGVKRAFDVVVAGALLALLAPVLVVCAVAVRFEVGPGVIFRQRRVGRDGKVFDCLKFCSLRSCSSAEGDTRWSIAEDDRVGTIGRVLRRTSLDELPQLWNILRGDMTLVGPRPERPYFAEQFAKEYDRYSARHRVRAGLTGFAQVSGLRGNTSIADRARHDNYYIENWSLWLDIKILIRTFSEVFLRHGR